MATDYQSIDRPYNAYLLRGATDLSTVNSKNNQSIATDPLNIGSGLPTSGGGASSGSGGGSTGSVGSSGGSVETMPVKSDGALSDIWIKNFIRSENWKPKTVGFYIDGGTGYAEFTNVFVSGEIKALTGLIGGFTIGATDLSATDGVNTTILSSGPVAFTAGPTGAPTVTITQSGYFTATRANITGSITAQSGAIGGFEIDATSLFAGYGPTRIKLSTVTGINLGSQVFGLSPFRVSLDGALVATNATITGMITANSGVIGGWTIGPTSLYTNSISLDAQNQIISVGASAPITIDGVLKQIKSSNYVSGIFGTGFFLSSDLLEVGNISARGLIRTAVFQKDVVSAVGGNLAVLDGDVLDVDMTSLDSSTMTIKGVTNFAYWDILRIKDGVNDEWFQVTDATSAPVYVVTRDKASQYAPNANPEWKKGAAIINYRQAGDGGIYMTASETNAPYISVFDHQGAPWSSITTRARLGNLNGYMGYTSDLHGIAIGETNSYLKYDTANGLRMQGNITVGTSDSIKGGQTDFGVGNGFFLGYSGDYKFSIGNDTNYITWDGIFLRIKGSFDVGDNGVINNSSYLVVDLPVPPTTVGFNNPSGLG
jgi:hypothetical protein